MKKVIVVVVLVTTLCFAQGFKGKVGMKGKVGIKGGVTQPPATVNCGYSPTTPASSDNNADLPQAVPCTTGANVNGYGVASVSWYSKSAGADTLDLGVYTSSGSGASLVPSTRVCHVSVSGSSVIGWNTKAITGCGTLSASTTYFAAFIDASVPYGYDAGNCPGFSVPMVAGPVQGSITLPTPYGATSTFGECQGLYMTLNVL